MKDAKRRRMTKREEDCFVVFVKSVVNKTTIMMMALA